MFTEFSKKVVCNTKIYYFDVKKSVQDNIYLKMTCEEFKNKETIRNDIFIFEDHYNEIIPVLVEALKYVKDNMKK
jgi:hypothetical protein